VASAQFRWAFHLMLRAPAKELHWGILSSAILGTSSCIPIPAFVAFRALPRAP